MEDVRYCMCCDDQVPVSVIEGHERTEVRCAYCGFILDIQKLSECKSDAVKGHALIADDSKYTRKIIEEILKEKRVSEHVESFENGVGLISAYAKLLSEGKPVDVVIIDLNMPVIDGITAALKLRTLEVQKNVGSVPIVFFSGKKADDDLRRKLEELSPAIYIHKSRDPDPDKLAKRVEELVNYVLAKYKHR